jgi:hypothetical protein
MNFTLFLVVAAVIGLLVALLGTVAALAAIYLLRRRGSTLERMAK